uniref:acyltransferase family protein n=1 Tax=Sphingomonas sp. TaxID=28214 RepID=UPI0034500EEE
MSTFRAGRDPNIDLMRAAALLGMVSYHLLWWTPLSPDWLKLASEPGAYSIDLFFVLSGFLIGSLYWREERNDGHVRLLSFLKRRWLRTLPPYFAALSLSWTAVWVARGTSFDLRYLVFLQNYQTAISFFSISWTLCVEEHFYLVVPLGLSFSRRFRTVRPFFLAVGLLAPVLFRAHYADSAEAGKWAFGYYRTAMHVRFESLAFGTALAWVNIYRPKLWDQAARIARWSLAPMVGACLLLYFVSAMTQYILGPSAAAALFGTLLVAIAGRRPVVPGGLQRPVRAIAITSYSVYLIHALMIHAGDVLKAHVPGVTDAMLLLIWPAAIALAGYVFFMVVERGTLALRDRIAPNLSANKASVGADVTHGAAAFE